VPVAVTRPPVARPVGPPRNPGPPRGAPRPGPRPPHVHYKPAKVSTLRRYCVPVTTAVLVVASLVVIGILIKVVIDNYYFFCMKSFKFIPLDKWCDGKEDCTGGEDELQCVQRVNSSNTSIVRLSDVGSILQILASTGTWSYICADGFDIARAKAVCAEIGFSSKPSFSSVNASTQNGQFSNILLNDRGFLVIPTGACTSGTVISLRCIDCGINRRKERIIGGHDTSIENSPWQVSLQYMGQHSCGGSIITPSFILCAAHCFPQGQQQVNRWRVEIGHSRLTYTFASQVDKIYIPTSYNLVSKPNDIAILRLKSELSFSATVQPICLPGFDSNLQAGASLSVTGWGHTVEGGSLASTLQEVSVSVISNDICNNEYFGQILDSMMCAGRLSGGLDTCQGDSGGPLVSLGPNSFWQQNGIVSWGDGCGRPGKVGVYTRLASFLPWVTSTMKVIYFKQLWCPCDVYKCGIVAPTIDRINFIYYLYPSPAKMMEHAAGEPQCANRGL
ncbi:PREDICTED: transmembrane protease serine 4-like, partial [Nanorana parkeri]|uniref:transmembrane protease serine 4-like n=1 Tax=Nanorana parkeri TaxID=125878 RepID=UPI000854CC3B